MLKAIRNTIVANKPTQTLIRVGARRRFLPRAVTYKLPPLGAHPITTPAGNTLTYVADLDDMLARGIVWDDMREWERGSLEVFSRLVVDAERFVDVGAYTGVYSLIACADGPGEAIAFEPNPTIRPLLEANVAANELHDRITVCAEGVADEPGEASLVVPADNTAARVEPSADGPSVTLTTVDRVLAGRRADVIKIDVEGLEPQVIAGAADTLDRWHPALIVECLTGDAFDAVAKAVAPYGYTHCWHLAPGEPVPVSGFVRMPRHSNFLWAAGGVL